MKPHLIMPMGGAGSRFYKNGYMHPKPLIEIEGKPFFFWAATSISKFVDIQDLTFVVLQQHIDGFKIDEVVKSYFPKAQIVVIPNVLPGPVFSALKGVEFITDDASIIFNDCDHMFCCNEVNKLLNEGNMDADGVLLTFQSDAPQFSYVKYGDGRKIIGTVEKKVVSDHAICGAYIFRNKNVFRRMAEEYIQNCSYNECFMSGVYNVMCAHGLVIKDYLLDYHVEFGTPEEYKVAAGSLYFNSKSDGSR
ncbi:MAG: sugar phosphate nucleotidyltransferase [Bacteroidales bacterium]|nr:sugar phosphate nucleotidyltransferase [Lachnoclostridium sp.]MCM1384127.1 sugar phosphate nucleotidyltransferase [Lachnoclostridium sp.]MCM1465687.1 sugar phosphate nucleotidyltransferase [Bacteroidales bacterium]